MTIVRAESLKPDLTVNRFLACLKDWVRGQMTFDMFVLPVVFSSGLSEEARAHQSR